MLVRGTSARFYSLEFLHSTARRTAYADRRPGSARNGIAVARSLGTTGVYLGWVGFSTFSTQNVEKFTYHNSCSPAAGLSLALRQRVSGPRTSPHAHQAYASW
jgi:hypothetical protein